MELGENEKSTTEIICTVANELNARQSALVIKNSFFIV
jgi:hypothetical protein